VPFTVVPIFALDATKFGYLSTVLKSPSLQEDTFQLQLSNQILNHRKDAKVDGKEFRKLSKFVVVGADGGLINAPSAFTVGHCAAGALCLKPPPTIKAGFYLCAGCAKPVHGGCGYEHHTSEISAYQFTCFKCYDKFGRALTGDNDPDCHPRTKAKRAEMERSQEKDNDKDKPINLEEGPSKNTRGFAGTYGTSAQVGWSRELSKHVGRDI
jgi:hypothetical protein